MYYKCVVCISTFCTDDVVCSLQCGHVFHQNCVVQLNAFPLPRCPLCRCDSTFGIRRLYFSITSDANCANYKLQTIDVNLMDDLKDEVKKKSEVVQDLEKQIATMKLDHDNEVNELKAKFKKVENTNTTFKRDLKIAKEEKNKTQKENKKLCVENRQLLKKMEENLNSKKLKRNDNILQYQSASKAKANLMDLTPQMKPKTATSRKALSLLPSSTTSAANLNSHQFSMEPRMLRRNIAANVVKDTLSLSSGEKSTQKAPIKRRAVSSRQSLFHASEDKQTVKRIRGRMIDGELRPLTNL